MISATEIIRFLWLQVNIFPFMRRLMIFDGGNVDDGHLCNGWME